MNESYVILGDGRGSTGSLTAVIEDARMSSTGEAFAVNVESSSPTTTTEGYCLYHANGFVYSAGGLGNSGYDKQVNNL